jgi:Fic family protein
MGMGWEYAASFPTHRRYFTAELLMQFIKDIHARVHPDLAGAGEWRKVGVRVGNRICPPPQDVPGMMSQWAKALVSGMFDSNDAAYVEFEMIHPFADGNGRTGKILFNWLNGTLDEPILPKVPKEWRIP